MPALVPVKNSALLIALVCTFNHVAPAAAARFQSSHPSLAPLFPSSPAKTQSFWLTKHTRTYDVSLSYPRLSDLPNSAKLNHLIKNFVQAKCDDYCSRYFGDWKRGTPRGYLVGNYQVLCCSPHGVSIKFNFSTYYPDAITGSDDRLVCLNLDPEHGDELTIDRLFRGGIHYSEVLSVLSLHQLIEQGEGTELTSTPTPIESSDDNFENFAFSSNELLIFFEQQDGPEDFAHEIRKIVLPFPKLTELLSDRFKRSIASGIPFAESDIPKLNASTLKTQLAQISIGSLSVMIANHPEEALLYEQRAKCYLELGRRGPADTDLARAKALYAEQKTTSENNRIQDNSDESGGPTKGDRQTINSPEAKL